jgi:hypothetical protein
MQVQYKCDSLWHGGDALGLNVECDRSAENIAMGETVMRSSHVSVEPEPAERIWKPTLTDLTLPVTATSSNSCCPNTGFPKATVPSASRKSEPVLNFQGKFYKNFRFSGRWRLV